MGCFLACFGSSKDKKRRRRRSERVPLEARDQRGGSYGSVKHDVYAGGGSEKAQPAILNEGKLESPTGLISVFRKGGVDEFRDGIREPRQEDTYTKNCKLASPSGLDSRHGTGECRNVENTGDKLSFREKKVIFDSVVKFHEPPATCELLEKEEFSVQEKSKTLAISSKWNSLSEGGSSTLSLVSYPPNHRYQNCRESDDEEDGSDYEGSDIDVDDGELVKDEYSDGNGLSDSLCSNESTTGMSSDDDISLEVNHPRKCTEATVSIRGRDDHDQSMLNPVENLSQWKALKARGKPPTQSRKEKSALDLQELPFGSYSSEPIFNQAAGAKSKLTHTEQQTQPFAIDASLSNWLPSHQSKALQNAAHQQTVSQGAYSPKKLDDRPILGALTVEELKLMSRTSSPRTSPTKSPDGMAIIGTVGSFWSSEGSDKDSGSVSSYKGIPNTTSKYREDKTVNWHSTPFETRLEKALSRGSARA